MGHTLPRKQLLTIMLGLFALLLTHSAGPLLDSVSAQSGSVLVFLDPPSASLAQGQVTVVRIRIDASAHPVDAAQVYLDFDPAVLQVVDAAGLPSSSVEFGPIISSGAWRQPLLNRVDNATGRIGVAAAKKSLTGGGENANSQFVLAIVRFKALATVTATNITFDMTGDAQSPQRTKVYSGGTEVTGPAFGATMTIATAIAPAPAPAVGGGGGFGGYVSPTPSTRGSVTRLPTPVPAPIPPTLEPIVDSVASEPPVNPEFAVLAPPAIEPQISEIPPEAASAEAPQPSADQQRESSSVDSPVPPQVGSDIGDTAAGGSGFPTWLLALGIVLALAAVIGAVILNSSRLKQLVLRSR